jgi:hypothetical protein
LRFIVGLLTTVYSPATIFIKEYPRPTARSSGGPLFIVDNGPDFRKTPSTDGKGEKMTGQSNWLATPASKSFFSCAHLALKMRRGDLSDEQTDALKLMAARIAIGKIELTEFLSLEAFLANPGAYLNG